MATRKKQTEEPPRPLCSVCGGPATHEVLISTRELKLDRDAGVRSQAFWAADYRYGTDIKVVLCIDCKKTRVGVDFSVSVSVENAKVMP
jgi:hypothetical protein